MVTVLRAVTTTSTGDDEDARQGEISIRLMANEIFGGIASGHAPSFEGSSEGHRLPIFGQGNLIAPGFSLANSRPTGDFLRSGIILTAAPPRDEMRRNCSKLHTTYESSELPAPHHSRRRHISLTVAAETKIRIWRTFDSASRPATKNGSRVCQDFHLDGPYEPRLC